MTLDVIRIFSVLVKKHLLSLRVTLRICREALSVLLIGDTAKVSDIKYSAQIYPNPTYGEIQIRLKPQGIMKESLANLNLDIIDTRGINILFKDIVLSVLHPKSIDLNSLIPGIYFVFLTSQEDSYHQFVKLVKVD